MLIYIVLRFGASNNNYTLCIMRKTTFKTFVLFSATLWMASCVDDVYNPNNGKNSTKTAEEYFDFTTRAKFVIANMYSEYSNYIIMQVHPSATAILLSLFFSMLTGVFFGYYPANKASKMEVIDALRYE